MGGGLRPSKRESAMEQTMEYPTNNTGSPTLVRRKYSAEFKASVVEQCSQPGNTTAAVAKRHGIHVSLVRRWAQLMRQAGQSSTARQEEAVVESWTGASPDAPQAVTSTATAVPSTPATAATVPAFIALARGQTTQPAAGQAAPASPCAFDPQATVTPAWNPTPPAPPAPPALYSEAIHIQLHSGSAQVHIRWPTSAAAQCVQWMREGLAPLWQPAPTHHHLADNLPPDKPPPDGDALPHSSRPASPAARVAR